MIRSSWVIEGLALRVRILLLHECEFNGDFSVHSRFTEYSDWQGPLQLDSVYRSVDRVTVHNTSPASCDDCLWRLNRSRDKQGQKKLVWLMSHLAVCRAFLTRIKDQPTLARWSPE
jgi:hypothetical protein